MRNAQMMTPRVNHGAMAAGQAMVGGGMMGPSNQSQMMPISGMGNMGGGDHMVHGRLDALEQEIARMRVSGPQSARPSSGRDPFAAYSSQAHAQFIPMPMPMMHPAMMQQAMMDMPGLGGPSAASAGAVVPASSGAPRSREHQEMMGAHKELLGTMCRQNETHIELMQAHKDIMKIHKELMEQNKKVQGGKKANAKKNPGLGIVRLDYNYPPGAGDIDSAASFGYDVFYRVVPGLTFEMAQAGKFTPEVERNFAEAIKYLEGRKVNAITGDCGFMMAFQIIARKIATAPVFMSSMVQCPVIGAAFDPRDVVLVLTANDRSLKPQKDVLLNQCGFDVIDSRFLIVGCQNVPGFEAVAAGEAVDHKKVSPGIVKLVKETIARNPRINVVLMECTELPPYSDAVRAATDLAVFDAITCADFYINAYKDNPRFGINDWQETWDGSQQEDYEFGMNLIQADKQDLVNKIPAAGAKAKPRPKPKPSPKHMAKLKKKLAKKQNPILGVIRLDYNYPPAPGDIDCPGSYGYDVIFRVVPGMTFEMAQSGRLSRPVEHEFKTAIKWLETNGAAGITGDCGFMMAFQPLARDVATVPCFMSSMVQCPMISVAFDKYDVILILTANSATLKPQKDTLLSACGFDVDDDRFLIKGCQDVPGFDAVAKGEAVDVENVTPGIVSMTMDILRRQPSIRAILLECTELPPYSDALRAATGLPVWDAITNADFFISARKDNPRFGLNDWQSEWDGEADAYEWGQNLTAEQRKATQNA